MDIITDAGELVRRLRALAFNPSTAEELAGKLQAIPGSPADFLTSGAETLYAYRDQLDERGLTLLAQLYAHAIDQSWSGFNQGDRSARIVALSRQALGETGGGVAQAGDDWPQPDLARRDGFDWRVPQSDEGAASPAASPQSKTA